MKKGPIVLIEDDLDDLEIMEAVLKDLGIDNKLISFDSPEDAMSYLLKTTDQPFLILCDINLPVQSGLQFKSDIDSNKTLREKSIPFVFFSTTVDKKSVLKAYTELTVQGFFQKPTEYQEMMNTIRLIVDYWKLCHHPNS